MKNRIKKNSLYWAFFRISVIPIILLALVITIFSANSFAASMNHEVKGGLKDMCSTVLILYDTLYEGDYWASHQENGVYMMKGSNQLNGNYAVIDEIRESTGVDISFFYKNIRIITTIRDDSGNRAIGTKASAVVTKEVLEGGRACFYPSVSVNGKNYFAYYSPLFDSGGECIGMFFVGKPSAEVERLVGNAVKPIIYLAIFVMLIAGVLTFSYSGKLVNAIRKIELFLEKAAGEDLHADLDEVVLKRNDELSEMGRHAQQMQKSLRELVEQDILTKMNNRRNGEKLLKHVQEQYRLKGIPFCVAIGDIDHFKRVNDTYGHECGDVVLINIASMLKRHMKGKGFAARWGGEEFLLVFVNCYLEEALRYLEEIFEDIHSTVVEYREETTVSVTMTFGIVEGSKEGLDEIIKEADSRLYYGKNGGRDRIVSQEVRD